MIIYTIFLNLMNYTHVCAPYYLFCSIQETKTPLVFLTILYRHIYDGLYSKIFNVPFVILFRVNSGISASGPFYCIISVCLLFSLKYLLINLNMFSHILLAGFSRLQWKMGHILSLLMRACTVKPALVK